MDEADVPLKLLHASIFDMYKVIEPLVCCLKGIWVHSYTITPARLAPDLGSQGHLWSDNDVITSWLRLISTSDPFMHPYYAYTKCLSYWYAVSRVCWCPLYRYTGQVGPRFGDSGSLEEWKWCHNIMFWADIYLRPLHTYILDIYKGVWAIGMLFQGHVSAPLYHYTGQVGPRFRDSGSLLLWKWCHNVMFEVNIHFRPLHTSILGIYKVFEPLVCCLKGMWVHPYTVTLAKLALDLGILGSLEEWQWCHHNVMFGADIYLKPLHKSIVDIYNVF